MVFVIEVVYLMLLDLNHQMYVVFYAVVHFVPLNLTVKESDQIKEFFSPGLSPFAAAAAAALALNEKRSNV